MITTEDFGGGMAMSDGTGDRRLRRRTIWKEMILVNIHFASVMLPIITIPNQGEPFLI